MVAAVALQDFDPIAVRVLDEKEARHQRPVPMEFLDRVDFDSSGGEALVLGVEVGTAKAMWP